MAFQDGPTGLANRRSFDRTFAKEWARAVRGGTELSLIMIDVDLFKEFNDHLGHAAGDHCLKQVASALESALTRRIDFLGRYGGDEFAAILPFTDQQGALAVAESMRLAVEALRIPAPFTAAGQVTVSLGSASIRPRVDDLSEQLMIRADRGLYRAKRNGRNLAGMAPDACRIRPDPSPADYLQFPEQENLDSEHGIPFILVVDDDSRIRTLMEDRLTLLGARIASLPGAHSATNLLARQIPDLILSDVVMPGMDGFDFCQRCKDDPRLTGVPFVLFTSISSDLRERAVAAGADDYLSKMEQEHILRMRVRTNLELGLNRVAEVAVTGAQVLVVTKSPDLQDQMANQMKAAAIRVRKASGWTEALEALGGPCLDVIVLDAALLPEMPPDWWQTMRGLTQGMDLPVLAMATAQEDKWLLMMEHDFQDRLAKPLEAPEVRHRVLRMVRLARARRSPRLLARWSEPKRLLPLNPDRQGG